MSKSSRGGVRAHGVGNRSLLGVKKRPVKKRRWTIAEKGPTHQRPAAATHPKSPNVNRAAASDSDASSRSSTSSSSLSANYSLSSYDESVESSIDEERVRNLLASDKGAARRLVIALLVQSRSLRHDFFAGLPAAVKQSVMLHNELANELHGQQRIAPAPPRVAPGRASTVAVNFMAPIAQSGSIDELVKSMKSAARQSSARSTFSRLVTILL